MANVLNNLFGGGKPSVSPDPLVAGDDFADFSQAAEPSPVTVQPLATTPSAVPLQPARPYTKWYRLHERYTWSDFKSEGIILCIISVFIILHVIGASLNRRKAKKWIRAHAAPLAAEFAVVGYSGIPKNVSDKKGEELVKALQDSNIAQGDNLIKERSLFEFATYATGRANVAFLEVKIALTKRFNPLTAFFESVLGFFFESGPEVGDRVEATLYPFDGKEADVVPDFPGAAELRSKDPKSTYDNFVWAIVHKECMKKARNDRYDLSLTYTKDHAKLPNWLAVMSESAEITDALLTPELIKAAEAAGDLFEYLVVTDQPEDKPKTLNETRPRKRVILKYRVPSNDDYTSLLPIFEYFLRMPDHLVQVAHFRPEVLRKVKVVRDEEIRKIQKAEEESKAEERAQEREKAKKAKRDQELSQLDAKAQKKYLEREREKELKRSMKKATIRA
ncbi:uncharacterized protein CTHT_0024800 [Thermochaetoides thermophila DSM 1495]|uniref:Uncharacterized protein n=1 Tax=Chaetomium thermophilum (strain DSM 1495 / CBS 144.50 / IMI 039719) TaxID=759272 RepID=G0S5M5_CHATD|nr:hypothetical protein CTHT_0024800 [Thermochaetoides thermophila DSM 1495]EGS20644.1 hypothetical protein CTHT_0024800 [Thermochaetoides thermophila DSM 1495]